MAACRLKTNAAPQRSGGSPITSLRAAFAARLAFLARPAGRSGNCCPAQAIQPIEKSYKINGTRLALSKLSPRPYSVSGAVSFKDSSPP